LPSERSACLTDAEFQGKCLPDDTSHVIYLPDQDCQGICFLDAARVLQTQNIKANFLRTQSVKAKVARTTRIMASAFWTRSISAFTF